MIRIYPLKTIFVSLFFMSFVNAVAQEAQTPKPKFPSSEEIEKYLLVKEQLEKVTFEDLQKLDRQELLKYSPASLEAILSIKKKQLNEAQEWFDRESNKIPQEIPQGFELRNVFRMGRDSEVLLNRLIDKNFVEKLITEQKYLAEFPAEKK